MKYQSLLSPLLTLSDQASGILQSYFHNESYSVEKKLDGSPVTTADREIHALLEVGLSQIASIPILSEEGVIPPYSERRNWETYWLIDPLDGTWDFIHHEKDFTCNIALIHEGKPIIGVMVAPLLGYRYWALQGSEAYQQYQSASPEPITTAKTMRWLVGRRFDPKHPIWIKLSSTLQGYQCVTRGSALKLCLIAQGEYSGFIRLESSKEWDLAAGHCILEAAGGCLLSLSGKPIVYNHSESLESGSYLACANQSLALNILSALP